MTDMQFDLVHLQFEDVFFFVASLVGNQRNRNCSIIPSCTSCERFLKLKQNEQKKISPSWESNWGPLVFIAQDYTSAPLLLKLLQSTELYTLENK